MDKLEEAYKRGFIDGITAYAWWGEGQQYVGTSGKSKIKAINDVEQTWNYSPPLEKNHD